MASFGDDIARWSAVQQKNPFADGIFVYCVKTTGIYCRPMCKARLARRANVVFHSTKVDAEGAGFRPCKRCKPDLLRYDPQAVLVEQACRTIEQSKPGSVPALKVLAAQAGLTESHFHRMFKKIIGSTPKGYAAQHRATKGDAAANWSSGSSFVDDMSSLPNSTKSSCIGIPPNCSKEIEYIIEPWNDGFVLIALSVDGEICSLDAGDSTVELLGTLEARFPTARLVMSRWSEIEDSEKASHPVLAVYSRILEALVNPTGKIVDLPLNLIWNEAPR
ncbi:hypothetical protein MMC09_003414 [Bachmanniomyces sp. S44760]|nr:hypothetical protein [Bachmanniomyces sp. S44760]